VHGNPANLTNPFAGSSANVDVRIHEETFKKVAKAALASGALQKYVDDLRKASEQTIDGFTFSDPVYVVKEADIDLSSGKLQLNMKGVIPDYCDVFGATGDLGADISANEKISLANGQIHIESSTDKSLDWHYSDGWCAVGTVIATVLDWVDDHTVGAVMNFLFDLADPHGVITQPGLSGIFLDATLSTGSPILGTEQLLRVDATRVDISDQLLVTQGVASLQHDDQSMFVYARFDVRDFARFGPSYPLAEGTTVRLVDEDVPAPSGDDVVIPPLLNSQFGIIKIVDTYHPPLADQVLATGVTDDQGRVRFTLSPSQVATTAGFISRKQTTPLFSTTKNLPIAEAKPDLYFQILRPGGSSDTRALSGGLIVNAAGNHVGTRTAPLGFTLAGAILVASPNIN
jgi:hypothetical protein